MCVLPSIPVDDHLGGEAVERLPHLLVFQDDGDVDAGGATALGQGQDAAPLLAAAAAAAVAAAPRQDLVPGGSHPARHIAFLSRALRAPSVKKAQA